MKHARTRMIVWGPDSWPLYSTTNREFIHSQEDKGFIRPLRGRPGEYVAVAMPEGRKPRSRKGGGRP